jgi:hypothetical protein
MYCNQKDHISAVIEDFLSAMFGAYATKALGIVKPETAGALSIASQTFFLST